MLDFISELTRKGGALSCPHHPPTSSPRRTQEKDAIPDLVFAVCTAGSSGSQARREFHSLLTILHTHRYIMASPSSKIKMNIWERRSFGGIFFYAGIGARCDRHTGKQNVGGPAWLESSKNTKLSQWAISLLLDTLLLFARFLAASEAAERSFPKGLFRLMAGYYNFLRLCGQSSHPPFNIYSPWDLTPHSRWFRVCPPGT